MTAEIFATRLTVPRAWLIGSLACVLVTGPTTAAETTAQAGAVTCPAQAPARADSYLIASQADIVALLPPPPLVDSPEQMQDLQAVLQAQRSARTSGTMEHALADAQADCARFADAIGPALTAAADAPVLAFLNHAAGDGAAITGPAKTYWHRSRPFAYSPEVERFGDVAPKARSVPALDVGTRAAMDGQGRSGCSPAPATDAVAQQRDADDRLAHSSYPSGHAAFGQVCAILLADMVPEKRAALFARSMDYSHSRLVLGAHFPSDVEAGRVAGTVAAELLMQNEQFHRDFAAARRTLRAAMGLPDATPEPAPGGATVAPE